MITMTATNRYKNITSRQISCFAVLGFAIQIWRPRREEGKQGGKRESMGGSLIIVIGLLDVVYVNISLAFVVPHCQPIMTHRRRSNHHRLKSSKNRIVDIENVSLFDKTDDDEPCLAGDNVVASCVITSIDGVRETDPPRIIGVAGGTQNKLSATINLCKCICGAGSFALPYVFLKDGVIGGTLLMLFCGYLAAFTMKSLNQSRTMISMDEGIPPTSYVELTDITLGTMASRAVFALTLAASLGVCSTYLVFIGQTLASFPETSIRTMLFEHWHRTLTHQRGNSSLLRLCCLCH